MRASAANEPGALVVGGVGLGTALYHGAGENFCGAERGPFSSRNPERARSRKFSGQAENFRELNGPLMAVPGIRPQQRLAGSVSPPIPSTRISKKILYVWSTK